MEFREADSIADRVLLIQCLSVLALVIGGFIVGEHYNIRPGTTAMSGASILLLVTSLGKSRKGQANRLRDAFGEVEWEALFFFIGLFVVVTGVEHAGLLTMLAKELMSLTAGDPAMTA